MGKGSGGKYKNFRVPKISGIKPKFTVRDFVDGISAWQSATAFDFLDFVQHRFENYEYDFTLVENMVHSKEKIRRDRVINALQAKDKLVFVQKGHIIEELTYAELFTIMEFGRKDKGILPHPLLRKAFLDYHPIYKKRLKVFLLRKK